MGQGVVTRAGRGRVKRLATQKTWAQREARHRQGAKGEDLGWRSLLTLSNVISSYSISPSVPFTCNSSTGQKHKSSETDFLPENLGLPWLLGPRPSLSPPSLL